MSQRLLSPWATAALVVASMIGTGIFTTTGFLVADLGAPWLVLLCWIVGGALALCGALVYAELGAMIPRAGGEYAFLYRAFGPLMGFLAGWVSLLAGFAAPTAVAALAFGGYADAALPGLLPARAWAIAVVVLFTALHMSDVLVGGAVQVVVTAAKVLVLAAFVVAALASPAADVSHFAQPIAAPGAGTFAVSLVYVSFSYTGWNAAAYVAGEVRDPDRSLPLALLGGTILVAAIYVLLNIVYFLAASPAELAGVTEVGHLAAIRLLGDGMGRAFSGVIAFLLLSFVSAMLLAGPRVTLAMAEDGLFFRVLARRNRGGAPWASVLLQGVLSGALILVPLDALLYYAGFTLNAFAGLAVVAALVLRRREPGARRPFRAPGWPVTPVLFLLLATWMTVQSVFDKPVESLYGLGTVASGLAAYAVWRVRVRAGSGSA